MVSKHRGTINSELEKTDEVIIHVESNDISKWVKRDAVTNNIGPACGKLREINQNIEIAVSSIFLQKYDTTKTLQIIETNVALERYCLLNGFDFLNNSNITFKHLDKWGMHLAPEGYRLFASNVLLCYYVIMLFARRALACLARG